MQATLARVQRGVLLTGLYFAGAVVAVSYLRTPADVTLFWPAAGIGFAMVLRYGLVYVLTIPLAMLALHAFVLPVPAEFLPYSIGSKMLATLVAGWYVRSRMTSRRIHLRTADGLLLLRGGLLLSATSACIGAFGMVHAGMAQFHDAGRIAVQWAMGDLLGVASVSPVLLYIFFNHGTEPALHGKPAHRAEMTLWSVLLVALLGVVYAVGQLGSHYPLALASLPLSLLVWSAVRYPPLLTLLATSAVIIFVSLMTGLGLGGFERPQTLHDSVLMMSMLVVYSIIPALLLASRQEHAHASAALQQRATRDLLTGLLNRDTFEEQARQILAADNETITLLYADLDHFKLVNDSATHVAGDEMIRQVAGLFRNEFGEDTPIARTGGDEFAALLPMDERTANTRARRLLTAIEGLRVAWQGQNLGTTGSIGLATSKAPHMTFDELLSLTDAACFAAKELGGNRSFAAASNPDDIRMRTRAMHSAMAAREALDQRRIDLWCQPIVNLCNQQPLQSHFEILVRWRDKDGNLRPPAEMIAAAERYRLGPRLDRYVLDATLTWLEQNPVALAQVEQCNINIGGTTLVDEDFGDYFAARLRRSPLKPEQLCLEITETSVVRDMTRARRFIDRVGDLGCRFALDDFGTGFCSFGYLRELDVDYLKIDGSFVRELGNGGLPEAVVRSITEIAHVLNKRAVAEQAETEAQLEHLRRIGVDYAQGYVFQRPQPIETFFGINVLT
ncbi:EAL domain-containing protein [Thermomonas sp.]|uniref:putative bifunctional diguanylate cyclase/phosphodiesterase n=1 Tax=Thermomonas sp. TaxID=1971895 RepID=UPI002487802B|nr:EAL domain-containing protein [Thermomonas sp.]MDI1251866.1 EAL domain-containing protein [Thermomonas sp.]